MASGLIVEKLASWMEDKKKLFFYIVNFCIYPGHTEEAKRFSLTDVPLV